MPKIIIFNNSQLTEVYLSILKNFGQFYYEIIGFKEMYSNGAWV